MLLFFLFLRVGLKPVADSQVSFCSHRYWLVKQVRDPQLKALNLDHCHGLLAVLSGIERIRACGGEGVGGGGGGEGIREGLKELLPEIEGFKVYIHRGSGIRSLQCALSLFLPWESMYSI